MRPIRSRSATSDDAGAKPKRRAMVVEVDAFGEAQAHQQHLVGLLFRSERRPSVKPWPAASTRSAQRSGFFSVDVAMR